MEGSLLGSNFKLNSLQIVVVCVRAVLRLFCVHSCKHQYEKEVLVSAGTVGFGALTAPRNFV